jgi:hypothetical protein
MPEATALCGITFFGMYTVGNHYGVVPSSSFIPTSQRGGIYCAVGTPHKLKPEDRKLRTIAEYLNQEGAEVIER